MLKRGRFYHLLPQADLACPDLDLNGQWEAYAVVDKGGEQGAVWVFRAEDGEMTCRLHLRGLDAGLSYELLDTDTGQTVRDTGAELMEDGIVVDLSGRTSAMLLLNALDTKARV